VGLGGLSLGSAAPPNALNESVAEQYAHGVLTQAQTLTNARSMIEMAYRNNPNWRTWSREMFQANAPTLFRSIIRSQPADNALDRAADEGRLFNALVHLNPDWGSLPSDGLKLLLKQIESGYEALTHGEKSQQVLDDLASHRAILGDSLRALFQLRADRDAALPPNSSELTKMVHQLGDDWSGFKLKPRFIYVGSDTMRLTQVLVGVRTNVTPFATDAISRSRLRHRIKIGSTSNIKSRGNVYRSHNPDFRIWAFFAVSPKGDNALSRKQIEHVERAVHNRVEAAYAAEFVRRGEWFESTATGAHGPLGSANRVNQLLTFIRDTIVADDPGASGHETFPNDLTNRLPLTVQLQRDWDIVFAQ
jgi:hypothetical protein